MTATRESRNGHSEKSEQPTRKISTAGQSNRDNQQSASETAKNRTSRETTLAFKSATQPSGEATEIRNGRIVVSQAANNQEGKCSASWEGFERRTIAAQHFL